MQILHCKRGVQKCIRQKGHVGCHIFLARFTQTLLSHPLVAKLYANMLDFDRLFYGLWLPDLWWLDLWLQLQSLLPFQQHAPTKDVCSDYGIKQDAAQSQLFRCQQFTSPLERQVLHVWSTVLNQTSLNTKKLWDQVWSCKHHCIAAIWSPVNIKQLMYLCHLEGKITLLWCTSMTAISCRCLVHSAVSVALPLSVCVAWRALFPSVSMVRVAAAQTGSFSSSTAGPVMLARWDSLSAEKVMTYRAAWKSKWMNCPCAAEWYNLCHRCTL